MKQRALLVSLAALGCAVIAWWLFGSSDRGAVPSVAVEGNASAELGSEFRDPIDRPTESDSRSAAMPAPVEERAATELSGRAVLRDGAALSDVELRAVAVEGSAEARVTTDVDGRFLFADLPAGRYRIEPPKSWYDKRGAPKGDFDSNERDLELLFDVLRLALHVETFDGSPAPRTRVESDFARADAPLERPQRRTNATNDEGALQCYFRESGTASVAAYSTDGKLFGSLEVWVAPGVSAALHTLVLRPLEQSAALAVRILCDEPCGASSFLARLYDAEHDLEVRTLQDEDVGVDGFIRGLPPGNFRVKLGMRFLAPQSLYSVEESIERPVLLEANREAIVEFEVECGGRLGVMVVDPDAENGRSSPCRVFHRTDAGMDWKPLSLMALDAEAGTTLVGRDHPPGRRVVSESLFAPGIYWIVARAGERESEPIAIAVEACRFTEVELTLPASGG